MSTITPVATAFAVRCFLCLIAFMSRNVRCVDMNVPGGLYIITCISVEALWRTVLLDHMGMNGDGIAWRTSALFGAFVPFALIAAVIMHLSWSIPFSSFGGLLPVRKRYYLRTAIIKGMGLKALTIHSRRNSPSICTCASI
jgi:hypothetical protein